jgi:hypothetical protein
VRLPTASLQRALGRARLDRILGTARAHPKVAALVVAALVLTPIVSTGGQIVGLGPAPAPPAVTITTKVLRSGEVNSMQVAFKDTSAVIEMPRGFFVVAKGQVTARTTATSADVEDGRLRVIVPPTTGPFEFVAASSKGRWATPVEVRPGASPAVSGEDAVSHLEYITQAFQFRFSGSPKVLQAANHFRDFFIGLGFEAQMYFYPWEIQARPIFRETWINLIVVCGFQRGVSAPGEWVVVGAHMDSVPHAIEGAYDDGSGTSALLEVAQGLSAFKTRRTMVYCLWGGEEEGLYGSNRWVQEEAEGNMKLYINMDMAGLSWPAPFNFTAFIGPDREAGVPEHAGLVSLIENITEFDLRYPRTEAFDILEDPFGRSDHVSFWSRDVPTVFFFGADDVEYPDYHSRADTVETMVSLAGGRDVLVLAFDTLVWECFYLMVHADQHDFDGAPPVAP